MVSVESFWKMLAERLSMPKEVAGRRWKEIYKCYSSPLRRYHNLQHLQYMIDCLYEVSDTPDTVLGLAIIYHDLVYNTLRKDNEERSAHIGTMRMKEFLSEADQARLSQYILATKSHEAGDELQSLLIDIDLTILGKPFEEYRQYSRQIRVEYIWCPSFLYTKGRVKVLEHFLNRDFIYQTAYFRNKCEKQARENISLEIESLK